MLVRKLLGLSIIEQLLAFWRPVASAALMVLALVAVSSNGGSAGGGYTTLLLHIVFVAGIGASTYAAAMLLLWRLSGRPAGIEAVIHANIVSGLSELFSKPLST